MAYDATSAQSDWDFLVIVERRRLYTARAGLLLTAWLMGRLRTKRHRQAPDLFCFNHYLTTDGLALRHRSMFTGHGVAWLIPVMDEGHMLERLWGANRWMEDVVPRPSTPEFVRRAIPRNAVLLFVRRVFEFLLRSWIGSFVERTIQRWMQRRIMRDPATHARGGRVIADDFELEFHPHSFELVALNRYNATLKRYGMSGFTERDSGLRR